MKDKPKGPTRFPRLKKPIVTWEAGRLHRAVDQIDKILYDNYETIGIFQRAGELVRVFCVPERHKDQGLTIPRGTTQLQPLTKDPTALADDFNRIARFEKPVRGVMQRVDCPEKIASVYLSRRGRWKVPVLAGICTAPILRRDGTVLQTQGYDPDTRLWLAYSGKWPRVPENPTRKDALRALELLREPFAEFPWVGDRGSENEAVHLACILTAIQRRLLPACPLFGYSAPTPRTGKSLLAELVGIIATGVKPSARAFAADREEIRKGILATLRSGRAITNLDNVPPGQPLDSPDLARAITQSTYQDRVLGHSMELSFQTNVLWTATGNNLGFRGDLSVRSLLCKIDAKREHPETRSFERHQGELERHVRKTRRKLVSAALTILRAYWVEGHPQQNIPAWGGFDVWSREVRSPLVWLGMADPCLTRQNILAGDPDLAESQAIFLALHNAFGTEEFTVSKLVKKTKNDGMLRVALQNIAATGPQRELDPRKLGNWLRARQDRLFGGLSLNPGGKTSGAVRYRIRKQGS